MGIFSRVFGTEPERVEKSKGASGTVNMGGYLVSSEYQADLRNPKQAFKTWERMRRSDPSVRETLWHIYAPILNADWDVHAPDEPDELEQEVTAMVRAAYFEWLTQPFTEYLRSTLDYLTYGSMVNEEILQVVEKELRVERIVQDADMTAAEPPLPVELPERAQKEAHVLPRRQYITWRRFAPRLPHTITEWHLDANGELEAITQEVFVPTPEGGDWKRVRIPADRLQVFTHEKFGEEFTGISILRSAWKPWVYKEMIEKVAAISMERFGVGVPVVWIPRERENDDALVDEIEQGLLNLRAGEFSYLIFPGPKTTGNIPGFDFDIVSPKGSPPPFKEMLEFYRGEIAGALLARFKELGHTRTGARATANVQSEVWYNALHAIARYIEDVNAVSIKRLVDLNYEGVRRYPKLKASGIEARNLLEFAQAVALLTNASILFPDTPTRSWVRGAIDAPAEDEQEAAERAAMEQQMKKIEQLGAFGFELNPVETARPRNPDSSSQRRTQDGTKGT